MQSRVCMNYGTTLCTWSQLGSDTSQELETYLKKNPACIKFLNLSKLCRVAGFSVEFSIAQLTASVKLDTELQSIFWRWRAERKRVQHFFSGIRVMVRFIWHPFHVGRKHLFKEIIFELYTSIFLARCNLVIIVPQCRQKKRWRELRDQNKSIPPVLSSSSVFFRRSWQFCKEKERKILIKIVFGCNC